MEITNTVYARDREEWRAWLNQHHAVESEIWLVYYKKQSRQPTVTYDEAVEEALCFGWIDSTLKPVDSDRYAQKFTPRKDSSRWSATNKQRAAKMLRDGKMTPAGLAKITFSLDNLEEEAKREKEQETTPPDFFRQELESHPPAWDNFSRLPPSQQRIYINYVTQAKKEDTRQKRLAESTALLQQNKRLTDR